MKNKIINNINKILILEETKISESEIVYLLMETRKLIEHNGNNNYQIVKFYCDWIVHTKKDRITSSMKKIIEKMYSSVKYQIDNPFQLNARLITSDFAYFKDLKTEIKKLYKSNNIASKFIENDNKWNMFISILVKILENQPIINPISEVKRIVFLPANDNCVIYRIEFNNPIKAYPYYEYMNAY